MKKIIVIALTVAVVLMILAGCSADMQSYEPPVFGSHAADTPKFQTGDYVWCVRHGGTGYGFYAYAPRYKVVAQVEDYVIVTYLFDENTTNAEMMERIKEFADEQECGIEVFPVEDCYADGQEAQEVVDAENHLAFGDEEGDWSCG